MDSQFFPVLPHFVHGNIWTGSDGSLRYRLVPDKETITAQIWQGPLAFAEDRVEDSAQFPLSQEGLEAMKVWLKQNK